MSVSTEPRAGAGKPVVGGARPRLLWVNQFAVAPTAGGGTRHFEIGRELVKLGWDVTIAASDFNLQSRTFAFDRNGPGRSPVHEEIDGVRFCWLWAAPYERNDWRRGHNWLSFANSLKRYSRELGRNATAAPDIVIGSSPQLFAARAAMQVSRKLRVPFVFEVRDLWPESLLAAGGRRGPAYRVLDHIAQTLYHRADGIVVLARGSQQYLVRERNVDQERIRCIPNGVDPEAFTDVVRPARETVTFVYTGAHGPANGLDVLLDAAGLLRDRLDIRILLIGSGPEKNRLQETARREGLQNVRFLDPIPKQEIPHFLAAADAGLMLLRPSDLFSFGVSPNKLFDYMAAGLPVVCNVPGEVAEMVADAGCGLQAEAGSAPDLARAMRTFADAPVESRTLYGNAGREWVRRENTRQVLANRLDDLLSSLLAVRGRLR